MKTDRELLELAAKAAGIFLTREQFERDCTSPWDPEMGVLTYDQEQNSISGWQTIYGFDGDLSGWGIETWSPLTDDGDALRLAVKLQMRFESTDEWAVIYSKSVCADQFSVRISEDRDSAARLVIVLEAAAIGDEM